MADLQPFRSLKIHAIVWMDEGEEDAKALTEQELGGS